MGTRRSSKLTAAILREFLIYNPKTGFFSARKNTRRRKVGDSVIGYINDSGYRIILVAGAEYRAHRLAWLYMFGKWPNDEIDHIDHDRTNNAINNLRDVTHHINMYNRKGASSHNKVGFLGVRKARIGNRFVAQLVIDGRPVHLGTFDTPEQAHAAYIESKRASGFMPCA